MIQHENVIAPRRIQLRRTKGWRLPPGAVVVARPSKWGNPVVVGTHAGLEGLDADGKWYSAQITVTPAIAVAAFRDLMSTRLSPVIDDVEDIADLEDWRAALTTLRGRDLACWCALDQPCHADHLLELANA